MDRLTRRIDGGADVFGMPLVSTYEIVNETPGLANAQVRCQLGRYEDTRLTPDEIAALRAELDAAQRRADSAVGWADCIVDVMTSSRRGIVEERFSALAGYRKWRETDRRGPDAPSKEEKSDV